MYVFLLLSCALASASDAAFPLFGRQSLLCLVQQNTFGYVTGFAPCGSNNGYVNTGCFCCGGSSFDAVACESSVQTCVTLNGAPFCQDIADGGNGGGAAATATTDYAAQPTSAETTTSDYATPTTTTSVGNVYSSAAATTFASSPSNAASQLAFSKMLSGGMILLAAIQG